LPLRHRHGYHAALHRGLPAGTASPAQEFLLRDEGARRTAPGPDPPGSSRSVIKGRMTPVPLVLLSVMLPDPHHLAVLARPGPVGAACHPPRHLPVQAAPSFLTPTASGAKAKVSHLHSNHSASRRTAVFTNSPLPMLEAEKAHRAHAIVEQVIADLKNGPLAHLPSGSFAANSAWVVCAAMAFNLTRSAGALASVFHAKATTGTLRAQLINVPARLARSARRLVLHLPTDWPWDTAWNQMANAARHGPPAAA